MLAPVSVSDCPSVTSRSSIETDEGIKLSFGIGLPSTRPTPCFKKNSCDYKGTSLWNFVQKLDLDLETFAAQVDLVNALTPSLRFVVDLWYNLFLHVQQLKEFD